jgi:hypothetical protein
MHCSLGTAQHFEGVDCFHLQAWRVSQASLPLASAAFFLRFVFSHEDGGSMLGCLWTTWCYNTEHLFIKLRALWMRVQCYTLLSWGTLSKKDICNELYLKNGKPVVFYTVYCSRGRGAQFHPIKSVTVSWWYSYWYRKCQFDLYSQEKCTASCWIQPSWRSGLQW